MPRVEVDVDLYEFTNDELVYEICDRIKRKRLKDDKLQDLLKALNGTKEKNPLAESLTDVMKYEHLIKVFDQYSLSDIESALPSKI